MRCDDVRKRISLYVTGRLPDMEVVAMDYHLDRCDACMKAVDDYLLAHRLSGPTPEKEEMLRLMRVPMPPPEQVQAGVDAVLQAIQMAEAATAAHPHTRTVPPGESVIVAWSERLRAFGRGVTVRWAYGLVAIAVVGLVVFVWNREVRYRALEQQLTSLIATVETLKRQNESLIRENAVLQRQVAQASVDRERTRQLLVEEQRKLKERIAQLQQENKTLKAHRPQPIAPPQVLVALRDESGMVKVSTNGTVCLGRKVTLPSSLAQLVREFITTGSVTTCKACAPCYGNLAQ